MTHESVARSDYRARWYGAASKTTTPATMPPIVEAGELASRFARTGAGRDWLHAFARYRTGRFLTVCQGLVLLVVATLIAVGLEGADSNLRRAAVVLVAGVVHSAASWIAWRYGLLEPARAECGAFVANHSLWQRLVVGGLILGATAVLAVDLSARSYEAPGFNPVVAHVLIACMVQFTSAVFASAVSARMVGLVPLGITALVAGVQTLAGMPAQPELWVGSLIVAYLLVLKLRLSNWHERLWAEWEADLELLAELAATEERLAISRDLHDTTGQSLTTIAIKAELANALLERGDSRAINEVREVSRLARDLLDQTRDMVTGYRKANLISEIASARTLIEAIGCEPQVTGSADQWPENVREVLGWALKEAVTNITRHARPKNVVIELNEQGGRAQLVVRNDGVVTVGDRSLPGGSGLTGLRERLAKVGGTLTVGATDYGFELSAAVPLERQ